MTDQQGTSRGNPYMRWLYIVGGLLTVMALALFSAESPATDRLGLAVMQIGAIAIVGAAVAGGITWQPKKTTSQSPPEGWYADPDDSSMKRWWDGQRWGKRISATG